MIKTKICSKCGISKPLDEFHNHKECRDDKRPDCKKCVIKRSKKHYQEHREEILEYSKKYGQEHREEKSEYSKKYYEGHREETIVRAAKYREEHKEHLANCARERMGYQSMYENKLCPAYLGIVIGERLCRHLFKDVEVMPRNNTGYDIICNRGKKIDVKTSSTHLSPGGKSSWTFHILNNTIADYFICVSFDNRTDLNPIHLWMIPGYVLKDQGSARISLSTIHKWDKWKMEINDAQICCAEIKEANHDSRN